MKGGEHVTKECIHTVTDSKLPHVLAERAEWDPDLPEANSAAVDAICIEKITRSVALLVSKLHGTLGRVCPPEAA